MTNFAKIENNTVVQIIVAEQDVIDSGLFGNGWVLVSENPTKGCIAFNGCKYNEQNNAFYSESSFPSWRFNQETFNWESPNPYPTDGEKYYWDETLINWIKISESGIE